MMCFEFQIEFKTKQQQYLTWIALSYRAGHNPVIPDVQISENQDESFAAYWEGVWPVNFLKMLLKLDLELNPLS